MLQFLAKYFFGNQENSKRVFWFLLNLQFLYITYGCKKIIMHKIYVILEPKNKIACYYIEVGMMKLELRF